MTTYGSAIFVDHVPPRRPRRSGGSRRAATRTSARRTCTSSPTASRPRTRTSAPCPNPLAPGRLAGGSSGGSAAALAAGLADAALGTDSRRLDPHPGRLVRRRRVQADVRARPARRLLPARAELRPRRADGAHGRRTARTLMRRARPGVRAARAWTRSRSVRVGVAWTSAATRSCARASRRRPRGSRTRGARAAASPTARLRAFMREVADVHRELFAEHAELYGDNVRPKIERCLAVHRRRGGRGRAAREELPRALRELRQASTCCVTPTHRLRRAAGRRRRARRARARRSASRIPFNALGWPALALPCRPGRGRPAGVAPARRPARRRRARAARPALRARSARLASPV